MHDIFICTVYCDLRENFTTMCAFKNNILVRMMFFSCRIIPRFQQVFLCKRGRCFGHLLFPILLLNGAEKKCSFIKKYENQFRH